MKSKLRSGLGDTKTNGSQDTETLQKRFKCYKGGVDQPNQETIKPNNNLLLCVERLSLHRNQ